MSSSFTTSSTSPPHYTLQCRACNKPITFDNKHISQRTGKKIPLDVQTTDYRKPEDIEAIDCSLGSLVFGDTKKGVTSPNFEASLTYSLQCSIGISGIMNPSIPDSMDRVRNELRPLL